MSGATISSGGFEFVDSGGLLAGTIVSSGGSDAVNSGGIATGTVLFSGGTDGVFVGGTAVGTIVAGGGEYIYSGGTASGAIVSGGGYEYVTSGGTAIGTVVSSGAVEIISSGGNASGTAVYSGGTEYVYSAGTASGTVVSAGATENVWIGATAIGTILAGGVETVSGQFLTRGTTIGTVILSGGVEIVSSGGLASGTVISSGGVEHVNAQGVADTTTISGGTLVVDATASLGSGAVTFAGTGGQLTLSGIAMPFEVISGFASGDTIDLAGAAFAAGGSVNLTSGNVLQVVESGQDYDLKLDPSQNFSGTHFQLTSDGSTGTNITTVTQIVVAPPDQDIWTTSQFSFAPGGGGPGGGLANDTLTVGGWGDLYYSLVKFNLTSLPTQASKVELRLFDMDSGGGTPTGLNLYQITQDWNWQTQGTGSDHARLWWADQPTTTLASGGGSLAAPTAGSYYYIDITNLYNAWQSGALPNYGLELTPTSNNNNFDDFASSRNANQAYQPALVITAWTSLPTVTGPAAVTQQTKQSLNFSSLISASESGESIASYTFYDSTPGAGYLTLDGQRINGTSVSISQAQLNRVGYYTGASAGSNQIAIDAFDSLGQSSADFLMTINVTNGATDVPPVVTGQSNVSYAQNTAFAFTSLIQATDSDGTVASYQFWDSTPGAGYLTLNGHRISGPTVIVSAANLGQIGYFTGNNGGTNQIAIDAIDDRGVSSADLLMTINVAGSVDLAPTLVIHETVSYAANTSFDFTSLIHGNDADGTVASYTFSDATPGDGYLTLNGQQINGSSVTVAASQLNTVGYVTGSIAGSNQIAIAVTDNQGFSSTPAIMTIDVTGPSSQNPQIIGNSHPTLNVGTSLNFADLIQASAPAGSVASFTLSYLSSGIGYLTLDSKKIDGYTINIAASQLGRVGFYGGPFNGTNEVTVKAVDNQGHSSAAFDVNLVCSPGTVPM